MKTKTQLKAYIQREKFVRPEVSMVLYHGYEVVKRITEESIALSKKDFAKA